MSSAESNSSEQPLNPKSEPDRIVEPPPSHDHPASFALDPHHVFLFLLGLRLLNALSIRTFFQPDEYFQALEPAWQWAFGDGSGAWITWEWKSHLRSAIHPTIFGVCYWATAAISDALALGSHARSELLLAAPKALQSVFAAVADFYTWKLASYVYGRKSACSLMALVLTVVSPWQWFVATRTFSNSLETTLTAIALYNWPWHWTLPVDTGSQNPGKLETQGLRVRVRNPDGFGEDSTDELTRLRRALLCAAVATILRPTNILVWCTLGLLTFVKDWKSVRPTCTEFSTFVRETVLCGSTVLVISTILDRIFYDEWVFPPFRFLYVNVVQSVATFYGNNDWHYYISQGYPLLLTTALPFTLISMYRILTPGDTISEATPEGRNALRSLCIICLVLPAAFSNIAHKEVRFIYPLLPALHVVTGLQLSSFFEPMISPSRTSARSHTKKFLVILLLALNASIAYYTSQVHNSGLINLTTYFRHEFEDAYLPASRPSNMTVGMLMPCHSTPWRSHLQYPPTSTHPGIRAWALTCEPPLNLNASEKARYMDEADQFYDNPSLWLKRNMSRRSPRSSSSSSGRRTGIFGPDYSARRNLGPKVNADILEAARDEEFWETETESRTRTGTGRNRKPWPEYLIFFAQLEQTLAVALRGSGYIECKRLWNSAWHDDWRRTGDVVVWCLDPSRVNAAASRKMGVDVGEDEGDEAGVGVSKAEIEDDNAVSDPAHAAGEREREREREREGVGVDGQKVLSGAKEGKGPKKKHKQKKEQKERGPGPGKRVVEKTFWKSRDVEGEL
ncbi:glycosylphosphatidylinositol anchor biosynthesis [Exophiala xenobiotica]|nr:glycosylphosphatidylinositol anchor biosynthesis [Exophiala xenobiotica]